MLPLTVFSYTDVTFLKCHFFFYAFCLFKFYCCQGRKTLQQQSHLTKTLNGKSFVKIILQKLLTMYTHECDESSCLATVKP